MPQDAIVTLLYNDSYLPGALTFAISINKLRSGSSFSSSIKLCVLLDPQEFTEYQLLLVSELYDAVIPTNMIENHNMGNFGCLDRPELNKTYTKIQLWSLFQFDKVLYVDCDTLPLSTDILRLFNVEFDTDQILASPDIGFPDCFNSGLFMLKPSGDTYTRLVNYNSSFDGCDQGLLNQFFNPNPDWVGASAINGKSDVSKWIKLPFLYNVTPSANYQYLPALNYYGDQIKLFHFIGKEKPWFSNSNDKWTREWWDCFNGYYGYTSGDEKLHMDDVLYWERRPVYKEEEEEEEEDTTNQSDYMEYIFKEPQAGQPVVEESGYRGVSDITAAPPDPTILCSPEFYKDFKSIEPHDYDAKQQQNNKIEIEFVKIDNQWDQLDGKFEIEQENNEDIQYEEEINAILDEEEDERTEITREEENEQTVETVEECKFKQDAEIKPLIQPIFPWEFKERPPPERTFDNSFNFNFKNELWDAYLKEVIDTSDKAYKYHDGDESDAVVVDLLADAQVL